MKLISDSGKEMWPFPHTLGVEDTVLAGPEVNARKFESWLLKNLETALACQKQPPYLHSYNEKS